MLKCFPRILRIRIKNEEYAERNFPFQQCIGTLKGQYFKKLNDGYILVKNVIQKNLLSAYMDNTPNGEN